MPLKFTEFHVSVRDYQTGVEIGTGNKTMTVDGRKTTDVTVSRNLVALDRFGSRH